MVNAGMVHVCDFFSWKAMIDELDLQYQKSWEKLFIEIK